MVAESWFRSLWKTPRKADANAEKVVIGVLAFEIASLMSKLIHLWQSLSDKQVSRLREEITNSVGIKKLVSENEDFIARLICAEMFENMLHVAKSVTRLAKKCSDPSLKGFENVLDDFISLGLDPYGWEISWRKMERKVKKMEKFISTNASLYREMEVLADLEQTLGRMNANDELDGVNLVEYQKKVARKRQEVKNLKEISLWNRTYNYTIHLLARSLFTILSRIKHVFGIQQSVDAGETNDSSVMNSDYIYRSQSVSAMLQSSVQASENGLTKFASGPLGGITAKMGPIFKTNKTSTSYSGPFGDTATKSGPISGKNKILNFYSGPLAKDMTRSGPITGTNKTSKMWKANGHLASIHGKKPHQRSNRLTQVGPFKGCVVAGSRSPITNCYLSTHDVLLGTQNRAKDANSDFLAPGKVVHKSLFSSKRKLLDAPPETLGAAALALHYANVIIVIEKLAASPHLIGLDAREDIYNMLPTSVRAALREKLNPYTKTLASLVYDTVLAKEWTDAMSRILEWLAPLAHNMIRWQSERSFEQQNFVSRTNVLLVQTLYFANQEKTEAAITELLVGLNYVWRYGRELNAKALAECASSRICDENLDMNE
ncbi:hypothetical protein O6P43_008703 [Quillaja saponaria]|uniref:Uncharacterized protein n=1 Tax=Quillaja saponaria TaxID=32244 RepID=A0AAD7PWX5_QUISA|nr:hypothetical protein O6P43_008703 [Quillaja saponaria]KAJ7970530.1 hypothetical protein O6P43_008703 [Quillaja saponaria]